MNIETASLIKDTWEKIAMNPKVNMMAFYDRLFEIAPQVRPMFPKDMSAQSEKLAYTISYAVSNYERLDEIKEAIEDLGRVHNRLNIKEEHYGYVKEALLWTMSSELGKEFTDEAGQAWDDVLSKLAEIMLNAPAKRKPGLKLLWNRLFGQNS